MKSSGTLAIIWTKSGQIKIARKMKKYLDSLTTGLIFSKHPDKSMLVQTDLKVLGQFSRLNAHKLSGRYIATQIFHPLQAYPLMIKCQLVNMEGYHVNILGFLFVFLYFCLFFCRQNYRNLSYQREVLREIVFLRNIS